MIDFSPFFAGTCGTALDELLAEFYNANAARSRFLA
jgi:hypothetical protein